MMGSTYFITNLTTNGHLHCNDLRVESRVQHRPEVTEFPLAAQQPCEVNHLMLGWLILAVSGLLVCFHSGCNRRKVLGRVE
jgi:hypothetical protein